MQKLRPLPTFLTLVLVPAAVLWLGPERGAPAMLAALVLGLTLGMWLSIALHELGHVLGGRLAGLRFMLFVAVPLRVRSADGRLRVEEARDWVPPGMALLLPADGNRLNDRVIRMVAGGPLANLASGLLVLGGIAALRWFGEPGADRLRDLVAAPWGGALEMALLQFAAISLFFGVLNLLTVTDGGMLSDGARIRMLRGGGPEADRWTALWLLISTAATGRRPREWDAALVERSTALADGSLDEAGACLYAYAWALDRGDAAAAERYLERSRAVAGELPALSGLVSLEAAYFAGYVRRDAVAARALLDAANGPFIERHARLRAEAAVLLAEGRAREAAAAARRALEALAGATISEAGSVSAYRDWLQRLAAEADAEVDAHGDHAA